MKQTSLSQSQHFFTLNEIKVQLPETADTILQDVRMAEEQATSCRLIRIYKPLPLHFHQSSSENVYLLTGRARFQLEDDIRDVSAGTFIHFPRNTIHGILKILDDPLYILTIDTPCRPEEDVTFCDPNEADKSDFNGR